MSAAGPRMANASPGAVKRVWLCVVAALALVVGACAAPATTLFYDLGLVSIGLDYPHSQQQLARCREARDQACLQAHDRVKSAKQRLFAADRPKVLGTTLAAVAAECAKLVIDMPCRGAIVALNFFPSHEEGRKIRRFLDGADALVLDRVAAIDDRWLSVRADGAEWRQWVAASARLSETQRLGFLQGLAGARRPGLTLDAL